MATCDYCGEEEGIIRIMNPNFDENDAWVVCVSCDKLIKLQQKSTFAMLVGDDKKLREINEEIERLSEKTKKPMLNVLITKNDDDKYDILSVMKNSVNKNENI